MDLKVKLRASGGESVIGWSGPGRLSPDTGSVGQRGLRGRSDGSRREGEHVLPDTTSSQIIKTRLHFLHSGHEILINVIN